MRHPGGPALVLASPGSGKTYLIVSRVRYLIEVCQVPPDSILVITFTKAAALSMQKRFVDAMGGKIMPVRFGTFHAVFYQILREYGSYNENAVLTNKEKMWYLQDVLERFGPFSHGTGQNTGESGGNTDVPDQKEFVCRLLQLFGVYKNDPSADLTDILPREVTAEQFGQIYKTYQDRLQRDGKLDFDDMTMLCLELMQRQERTLQKLRERYRYILVDEYQDTNPLQDEILRLLAGQTGQVFAVGDDDQAIYGFRGSVTGIMRDFPERYPGAVLYELNQNYRSTRNIVDTSMKMILENKNRYPKQVISQGEEGEPVHIFSFETREQEGEYLARRIRQLAESIPYEEMAVIARTNREAEGIGEILAREGIPYEVKERTKSRYGHFLVQELRECMAYLAGTWSGGSALWRRLKGREKDRKMLAKLAPWAVIHYLRGPMGWDRELLERAREKYRRDADKAQLLYQEWMEVLNDCQSRSKPCKSIRSWLQQMEEHVKQWENQGGTAVEAQAPPGVQLLTMHGSKGLEFTYVCLPDVNEGIIPGRRSRGKEGEEEERRLLYVAVTRAKKILDILYLTGTKEYPRFPSRFLNPLLGGGSHSPTSSSNSELSKNSSKASATASYSSSSSM